MLGCTWEGGHIDSYSVVHYVQTVCIGFTRLLFFLCVIVLFMSYIIVIQCILFVCPFNGIKHLLHLTTQSLQNGNLYSSVHVFVSHMLINIIYIFLSIEIDVVNYMIVNQICYSVKFVNYIVPI